ncbi:protein of unknown function [Brochothrix thermosphacta]|nr:hypothetical protein BTH160X_30016 [Brochothrix thermosphacta]SPN73118.1 protein of unknown function [Brochothrix thermosphacta]SPN74352.1 hypothetical protein BTEBP_10144 [Brochothrix thermosphacta]
MIINIAIICTMGYNHYLLVYLFNKLNSVYTFGLFFVTLVYNSIYLLLEKAYLLII